MLQWGKHMSRNLNRNEEVCKGSQGENEARPGCGVELRLLMYFCVLNESSACSRMREEAVKRTEDTLVRSNL